jgi:predicted DNA-binding transcriptional regulator YafY
MNKARVVDVVSECMANNQLMSLTYKRERDKKQITRMVEPYEVKEVGGYWYLYAHDTTGGYKKGKGRTKTTKSFILENIVSVRNVNREFIPRYQTL